MPLTAMEINREAAVTAIRLREMRHRGEIRRSNTGGGDGSIFSVTKAVTVDPANSQGTGQAAIG